MQCYFLSVNAVQNYWAIEFDWGSQSLKDYTHKQLKTHTENFVCTLYMCRFCWGIWARYSVTQDLASYPGCSVWAEKKSLVHTVCACSVPPGFLGIWKFRKICSVTPTSARYADFSHIEGACHWPRSVWTVTKVQRGHSALHLQELSTRSWNPAKHWSTWLMQSFPLKFTDRFERSNAECHHRSDIVFDLEKRPIWVSEGVQSCSAAFQQVSKIDRNFSAAE